jgi:hypothetical protein
MNGLEEVIAAVVSPAISISLFGVFYGTLNTRLKRMEGKVDKLVENGLSHREDELAKTIEKINQMQEDKKK